MDSSPNPLDPKYAPGAEQARQDVMIGVSTALTVIAVSCVALRIYTRSSIVRNMGPEDWTIMAAATFTVVLLLQLIAGAKLFKLGYSSMHITNEEMTDSLKLILSIILIYKSTMTLIKISILLIYLRLATNKTFERLCKATMSLLLVNLLIVYIVVPAQCTPLNKLWDFTNSVEGSCIDTNAFYHATSIFHIIMDVWVLVLPLKLILRIPRAPREKIALIVIFGLGVISTLASIIRLQSLRIFTLSDDPFYDSLPINTWSMVEANVGILCACIPTLRPLVSRAQRMRTKNALMQNGDGSVWGGRSWKSQQPILEAEEDMGTISHSFVKGKDAMDFDEEYELDDRPPPVPPKDGSPEETPSIPPRHPGRAYIKT